MNTIVVFKAGSDGALKWANRYQIGRGCTIGWDLAAMPGGGAVIVAGVVPDFDAAGDEESAVLRIDSNGGIVWQTGFQPALQLSSIGARSDGTIVVAGGRSVISLTSGGSLAGVDSFQISAGGITALALFPDGYAIAASGCNRNSDGHCPTSTPVIARVGGGGWRVQLPFIPNYQQFEFPYALVAAPDGSVIVQTDIGRDARIDPGGAIVWNQIGTPTLDVSTPYPGAVDVNGVFWRHGLIDAVQQAGTYLHRIAPDGHALDLLIGSKNFFTWGVAAGPSGQMAFLGEDTSLRVARQVIVAIDPNDQACLAQRVPPILMQPASFDTSGVPPEDLGGGNGVAATQIPITAVQYCMSVSSADFCLAPTSQRRTPAIEQAPAGGCPPTLTFAFTTPQKALIHKYRDDDAYPSAFQSRLTGNRTILSPDGKIAIDVQAVLGSNPIAGQQVFLRVTDPPDTATYVVGGNDAHADDNVDPLHPKGQLAVDTPCNGVVVPSGVLCGMTEPDGWVHGVLTVTDTYAGDNYIVQAATEPTFACGTGCSASGLITAWKRVYYEYHRMFRQGSYIARHPATSAGGTSIWPTDMSMFTPGQTYSIRLIHAPRLERGLPISLFDILEALFWSEDHVARAVAQATDSNGNVTPAHLELIGSDSLQASYGGDPSFSPPNSQTTVPYLADALGIIGGGRDFYDADFGLVDGLYRTAFVEYKPIAQTTTEIPLQHNLDGGMMVHMQQKWKEAALPIGPGPASRLSFPNHQHVFGLTELFRDPVNPVNNQPGAELGGTTVADNTNRSAIWVGRIETAVTQGNQPISGRSPINTNREVVVHELGHQWMVNPSSGDGHCLSNAYTNDGTFCGMHRSFNLPAHNAELSDGVILFHYDKPRTGPVDSEYLTIRRRPEPVPQQ